MGKVTGFIEFKRVNPSKRAPSERIGDYREFELPVVQDALREQGARCMDCGVPFCNTGCPLGNLIPDWNDHAYHGNLEAGIASLHATNNFPEFTGRVCPAPCEASCVLNINDDPVSIKMIERATVDQAFDAGFIKPLPSAFRSGKRVAVVGSGPAGLAAAQQLARAGHDVVVFEKADRIGGLLRYGIPDFKLEKTTVERRVAQLQAEGVEFRTGVNVGVDVTGADLQRDFDAICLCGGSRVPRDLPIPGREFNGIHYAMDFLTQQNRRVAGDIVPDQEAILATGKDVVVIGGGDTGSDCIGTSNRQGARSVTNFEIMPQPPKASESKTPWPLWPLILRTSSSHEEGVTRKFAISTAHFDGQNGHVSQLHCHEIKMENGRMEKIPGTEFVLPAQLVLLAMGFVHPEQGGILSQLNVEMTDRMNIRVDENFRTSTPGVYAAGDMQRGQSLVVWAIADGRKAARSIDEYLMGRASRLPTPKVAGLVR